MWIITAICLSIYTHKLHALKCIEPLPAGWSESYCPDEITRIEYQIPMSSKTLTGDSVAEIDSFIKWMVDSLENDVYKNYFRLRSDNIKKYYRVVQELDISKTSVHGSSSSFISPPRSSAIKYRRSFDNFKMPDSVYKYKNDLSWENAMTTPGKDLDYMEIAPMETYKKIYGSKLEANIMVDPCIEEGLANKPPIYGETGTGFSAKIYFDDDKAYGTNDTNGINMIDTAKWGQASDNDDSFYCDCNDPLTADCICCDVEKYFTNYCSYYNDDKSETSKHFKLITAYQYIVDIQFYWFKNGDANNVDSVHASKGKFTFQVQYQSLNDKENDIPNVASTELSMKLYKDKTKDVLTNWHLLTKWSEGLIDTLTSEHSGSSKWIDHTMCRSDTMCCTNLASVSSKWIKECGGYETERDCDKRQTSSGTNECQWISCDEVGDCKWNGVDGGKSMKNKCGKITSKRECETKFGGVCNWILRNGGNQNILVQYKQSDITQEGYNGYNGYNGFIVIFVAMILIIGCIMYSNKVKSNKFNSYTPLISLNEESV